MIDDIEIDVSVPSLEITLNAMAGALVDGNAVHYVVDTGKTDSEKAQARQNIGLSLLQKTSDMTQNVGLGSDGKLYTEATDITTKVDKAQGVTHAGEFLIVGNDGNVTTQSFSVLAGGSY